MRTVSIVLRSLVAGAVVAVVVLQPQASPNRLTERNSTKNDIILSLWAASKAKESRTSAVKRAANGPA
jgi:hypothetical protein